MNVACYLSSHGYGHAVRSSEVIAAIARLRPDWRIFIVTAAPAFLFAPLTGRGGNVFLRTAATDFGLVQDDPRSFSLEKTAGRLGDLVSDAGRVIEREREFLAREGIGAIWGDIPFLPFEAAAREGIASVGMGNFSWEWIYEYYLDRDPVFGQAALLARSCYAHCGLYFALPSSPPTDAFPQQEPIPLVTRKARLSRSEARRRLGVDDATRLVLVGFSELALPPEAVARVERLEGTRFILPHPVGLTLANGIVTRQDEYDFPSLVAACDVLLTKPGYGIVTDAIAANAPLVHTERGDFPEVPWLERLIAETVGGVPLDRGRFEAGDWADALDAARRREPPVPVALDGADVAARRFVEFAVTSARR